MESNVLSQIFQSVVDQDPASVVICDVEHRIIYMNPAAVARHAKRGGATLIGRSLLDCHNADSVARIREVVAWFAGSREHNRIFTYHNPKENKDVYMVALRDEDGTLIGYYEKHEYRDLETAQPCAFS